jgi:hypothetical protein
MGDLGKNTEKSLLTAPAVASSASIPIACAFQIGAQSPLLMGAAQDTTQGNPTQPSQSHPRPGIFKDIFWRVTAGSRTFSIDVLYTGTAPCIIVKRNPAVGLQEDVTVTAGAGPGWVTISQSFTATATGVVAVWRQRTDSDLTHVLNWDNVRTT